MVAWLKENRVLEQSLKGFLHHPQYCKRLEELIQVVVLRQVQQIHSKLINTIIIIFLLQQRKLSLEDVEAIWNSQDGQYDTVVRFMSVLATTSFRPHIQVAMCTSS